MRRWDWVAAVGVCAVAVIGALIVSKLVGSDPGAGSALEASLGASPTLTGTAAVPHPIGESDDRILLVSAWVSGPDNRIVDFSPIFAVTQANPALPVPPDDYSLEFSVVVWNGDDEVADVSIDVSPMFVADCDTAECQGPRYFVDARIPIGDAVYTRVELFQAGASLGFVDASAHAPVVGNIALAPGPSGGDIVTFDASDADGDALSSIVLYSTDGGETWDVLTQDTVGGYMTIDSPALPPSDGLLCRVEVSDGVLSASAVGGPFATGNTPPDVWAASELGATAFASGNQTVWISMVFALDNNHSMPASSITWESSIDGPLPGGGSLDVRASELSEGLHVITITATDPEGATGAWSGVLRVQREYTDAPAPPITDAETVTLLRTLAGQRGLEPGVKSSVDAAITEIQAALASGKASRVCAAFGALGDFEGKPGPALSRAAHDDAGSLGGLAGVLGAPHGCTSA